MSNLYFLRSINGIYPILSVVGLSPALRSSLEHLPRSQGPSEQMRIKRVRVKYISYDLFWGESYACPWRLSHGKKWKVSLQAGQGHTQDDIWRKKWPEVYSWPNYDHFYDIYCSLARLGSAVAVHPQSQLCWKLCPMLMSLALRIADQVSLAWSQ